MAIADVSGQSISELVSLRGRTAVVTGAARGIGRATASRLAEAGATVVIADIDGALATEVAAAIAAEHSTATHAQAVDVRDVEEVDALVESASQLGDGIDIFVNNAGIYPSTAFLDIPHDEWDRVLDTNVRGMFLCCQAVGRRMVDRGTGGVIVNVASTAAVKTGAGVAHYITSKHAVVGLTRAAAVELGPAGIRVLAVAPSMTQTEGRDAFMASVVAPGMEEFVKEMEERTPLGRIGVADDVARVVLFCASDMSILMTGSTLMVDSGEGIL
jgi:NAD(P)-dependent dehydrogenase (short-subunit alcohol dehydrogenase family)